MSKVQILRDAGIDASRAEQIAVYLVTCSLTELRAIRKALKTLYRVGMNTRDALEVLVGSKLNRY